MQYTNLGLFCLAHNSDPNHIQHLQNKLLTVTRALSLSISCRPQQYSCG